MALQKSLIKACIITKYAQTLYKNDIENIREYIYIWIKDNLDKNIYLHPNIITNVDETPITLQPITVTTLDKKEVKLLKFIILEKLKREFPIFFLHIFGNDLKAPPMLAFKGVPENLLDKSRIRKKVYVY